MGRRRNLGGRFCTRGRVTLRLVTERSSSRPRRETGGRHAAARDRPDADPLPVLRGRLRAGRAHARRPPRGGRGRPRRTPSTAAARARSRSSSPSSVHARRPRRRAAAAREPGRALARRGLGRGDARARRPAAGDRRRARPGRDRVLHLRPAPDGGLLRGQQAREGVHRHQQRRLQLAAVHVLGGGRLHRRVRLRRAAAGLRRPRAGRLLPAARHQHRGLPPDRVGAHPRPHGRGRVRDLRRPAARRRPRASPRCTCRCGPAPTSRCSTRCCT